VVWANYGENQKQSRFDFLKHKLMEAV